MVLCQHWEDQQLLPPHPLAMAGRAHLRCVPRQRPGCWLHAHDAVLVHWALALAISFHHVCCPTDC